MQQSMSPAVLGIDDPPKVLRMSEERKGCLSLPQMTQTNGVTWGHMGSHALALSVYTGTCLLSTLSQAPSTLPTLFHTVLSSLRPRLSA